MKWLVSQQLDPTDVEHVGCYGESLEDVGKDVAADGDHSHHAVPHFEVGAEQRQEQETACRTPQSECNEYWIFECESDPADSLPRTVMMLTMVVKRAYSGWSQSNILLTYRYETVPGTVG